MKRYLIAGIGLITIINVIVLTGVAYNRSEPYTSSIEMSYRDFNLPYTNDSNAENSAKRLRFATRLPNKRDVDETDTNRFFATHLSDQQLANIGLVNLDKPDAAAIDSAYWRYNLSHEVDVFLALELNGEEYQRALRIKQQDMDTMLQKIERDPSSVSEGQERRTRLSLEDETIRASRLFYIDAHKDSDELQKRYQDKPNVLLTKGKVQIYYNQKEKAYIANYAYLLVNEIMLPRELANTVSEYKLANKEDNDLLFTLHIGKRFEPWLGQIKAP
ncbi:MAG: hypothetical protein ACJAVV_002950 [Alphaproteobacteria bacterium]|jgi:hypothetical protein